MIFTEVVFTRTGSPSDISWLIDINMIFFSQEAIKAGFHLDGYCPAGNSPITVVRPESYFFTQIIILISEIYNIIRI